MSENKLQNTCTCHANVLSLLHQITIKTNKMRTRTETRIEMTEKNLQTVLGYSYNPVLLAEICANDYITDGEFVMQNGEEKVYFENGAFVTKNNGKEVKRFEKAQLNEMQQEQLFCIWAGKKATTPRNC